MIGTDDDDDVDEDVGTYRCTLLAKLAWMYVVQSVE
jgi:hypothetical protein